MNLNKSPADSPKVPANQEVLSGAAKQEFLHQQLILEAKKNLKFAFWDFQAKNGIKASLADFSRDPSFVECLNNTKRSGLTLDDMNLVVDFMKDAYGKKVAITSPKEQISDRYSVGPNDNLHSNEQVTVDLDLNKIKEDQKKQALEIEQDKIVFETRPEKTGTERDQILKLERQAKLQVETVFEGIKKQFRQIGQNVYTKRKEAQYEKFFRSKKSYNEAQGLDPFTGLSVERGASYMNDVYNNAKNYIPNEKDMIFSIEGDSLICEYTNTSAQEGGKNESVSFDLKDLDVESRRQVLSAIENDWKSFTLKERMK